MAEDNEFEERVIAKCEPCESGWTIQRDDGWSIFVTSENCQTTPSIGESIRLYGRGIGAPVRGISISGRVYRYESPTEHEASQNAIFAQLERERKHAEAAFIASKPSLPPLKNFAKSDGAAWERFVEMNDSDPYRYACVQYAADWAHMMESRLSDGVTVADIAGPTSHESDTDGITGFMYGAAVHILAICWERGEELRVWHNARYGVTDSSGTVNPAMLTVSV